MRTVTLAGILMLLAGCHILPAREPAALVPVGTPTISKPAIPAVVRSDRYLLLNTLPLADQQDPLNQIIDVTIPLTLHPTLGESMRYLLQDSGYVLCFPTAERQLLFIQPLPRAQAHIGPMKLRDALEMLAGSEWQLETDRLYRTVCFSLKPRSGERNA